MKLRRSDSVFSVIKSVVTALLILAVVIFMVFLAVDSAQKSRVSENARIIENGVRNAAIECYAAEGFYPDDIQYLVEKYNLYTDSEHFLIHYSPISANIMPDIKVIPKQEAV